MNKNILIQNDYKKTKKQNYDTEDRAQYMLTVFDH